MKVLMKALSGIGHKAKDIDVDDILAPLGLRRRSSAASFVVPAVSFLLVGGAVGAVVALLLAPSSGRRMRENVEERITKLRGRLQHAAESHDMPNSVGNSVSSAAS